MYKARENTGKSTCQFSLRESTCRLFDHYDRKIQRKEGRERRTTTGISDSKSLSFPVSGSLFLFFSTSTSLWDYERTENGKVASSCETETVGGYNITSEEGIEREKNWQAFMMHLHFPCSPSLIENCSCSGNRDERVSSDILYWLDWSASIMASIMRRMGGKRHDCDGRRFDIWSFGGALEGGLQFDGNTMQDETGRGALMLQFLQEIYPFSDKLPQLTLACCCLYPDNVVSLPDDAKERNERDSHLS